MRKAIIFLLCMVPGGALPAWQADAPLTFAVATIKPSAPDAATITQIRGNRFATEGTTFVDVFKYAFNLYPGQIVGGPEWLRTQKFDILADPETETRPNSDQFKAMVRQLLVERFHVVMHREQKLLPVYALVRTADEPKLKKSTADPGGIPVVSYDTRGELDVGNATMASFASFLQRYVLDRPAVDRTGIAGRFDLVLRWTPDDASDAGRPGDPQADGSVPPNLFTAIKEQLGLKLQPAKAETEVFVIDKAEQPSPD